MVMEVCGGVELFNAINTRNNFCEEKAANIIKQLLQVMAYCHANEVAHRDLKPENILIDTKKDDFIKVIDFGTSHHFEKDNNQMYQTTGTPYYVAPEVLKGNYTEKCDMWSIGVILYVILCGRAPFNGSSTEEIIKKVEIGRWQFQGQIWNNVTEIAKDLVNKLL